MLQGVFPQCLEHAWLMISEWLGSKNFDMMLQQTMAKPSICDLEAECCCLLAAV